MAYNTVSFFGVGTNLSYDNASERTSASDHHQHRAKGDRLAVEYQRKCNGLAYKHGFGTSGVLARYVPDLSLKLTVTINFSVSQNPCFVLFESLRYKSSRSKHT
ncbi:MAG: hypothetical protein ACJ04P_03105 [Halioglobus sp.]